MSRPIATLALALGLVGGLAACSTPDPVTIGDSTVIIDVRTPEEFAEGHLEGAINIDVQAETFDATVQQLDNTSDYVVYCRSGNRSAAAIDRMSDLGFTSLVNAGGLQSAASATGLEIVTP